MINLFVNNKEAKKRIFDFVIANYRVVDDDNIVHSQFSLSNSSCHYNSVAAYRAGRADKVYLAWGGSADGCIHFINSKDGDFFDETWHDWSNRKNYYRIIREINESEFDDIGDILNSAKRMLIRAAGLKVKSDYYGI